MIQKARVFVNENFLGWSNALKEPIRVDLFTGPTKGQPPSLEYKPYNNKKQLWSKHSSFFAAGMTKKKVLYNIDTWGLYYKTFYGSNCCRIV